MKVHKNKKNNKKWVVYTVVAVAVCVVVLLYWLVAYQASWWPFAQTQQTKDSSSTSLPHNQQTTNDNDINGIPQNETPPTDKTPIKYSPPAGNTGSNNGGLTGIINYKQVIDSRLVIRTTINQSINSGTCVLTLSNNGNTKKYTSDIAPTPTAATCNGFSIPVTDLGTGKWTVDIALTSGKMSGHISDSVEI